MRCGRSCTELTVGRAEQTIVTWTCDRCKFVSESPWTRHGYAVMKLEEAMKAYTGDVGGATREVFLCGHCASDLREFLAGGGCR